MEGEHKERDAVDGGLLLSLVDVVVNDGENDNTTTTPNTTSRKTLLKKVVVVVLVLLCLFLLVTIFGEEFGDGNKEELKDKILTMIRLGGVKSHANVSAIYINASSEQLFNTSIPVDEELTR